MKTFFFAAILFFSLCFVSCAELKGVEPASTTITSSGNTIEDDILVLINKYRLSKGLVPLKLNNDIIAVARKHSSDMADKTVAFGHDGFTARAKSLGARISGLKAVAENVAYGQRTAAEAVEDWIKSPGHRVNIEGNYTQTGIGVVANKKGVLYYTQIFVR